jgi:hypothetical protein
MNLGIGDAVCRVERSDADFNLTVPKPEQAEENKSARVREQVISTSRETYARPRAEIEAELLQKWQTEASPPHAKKAAAPSAPHQAANVDEVFPSPFENPHGAETQAAPDEKAVPVEPLGELIPRTKTRAEIPLVVEAEASQVTPQAVEKSSLPPKDLGRGGVQHQAIQHRIKAAAEALGFRAILEKETQSPRGSVDLFLEKLPLSFACEISISTTIDHEVGNVLKCVKAGYQTIAVVCTDQDRLAKICAAVRNSLGADAASRTQYFLPDDFIEYLRTLPAQQPALVQPAETRRGYKVKRNIIKLSSEEVRRQEHEALQVISENLRKGRKE